VYAAELRAAPLHVPAWRQSDRRRNAAANIQTQSQHPLEKPCHRRRRETLKNGVPRQGKKKRKKKKRKFLFGAHQQSLAHAWATVHDHQRVQTTNGDACLQWTARHWCAASKGAKSFVQTMTTATTSDKEQKYDRQLRLWGAQGQALLEGARVLLLTGDGAGSETLKNVVLPAIGSFAVLDDARVTSRDLADNFFVDAAHLGAPRAECVAALLGELNTDVAGRAIVRAVADVDEALLAEFSFVIACNVAPSELQRIAALLWARATPLVVVRTCGFLGVVRIAVPEHIVVETKIDNAADDLRVSDPFPELLAYATATPLDALDQQTRSHVPWICILVQFAVQWRAEHGGALPTSTADRKLFKQAVRNLAKTPQEENFPEAFNQAHTAYTPYRLPADVRAILDRASADKARALPLVAGAPAHAPAVFWRIMAGVAAFVAGEGAGKLPLAGVVPDLTATTSGFPRAPDALRRQGAPRRRRRLRAHREALWRRRRHRRRPRQCARGLPQLRAAAALCLSQPRAGAC
jgi:molybdopterin/thiamine biosynthesis adenylyltransferase